MALLLLLCLLQRCSAAVRPALPAAAARRVFVCTCVRSGACRPLRQQRRRFAEPPPQCVAALVCVFAHLAPLNPLRLPLCSTLMALAATAQRCSTTRPPGASILWCDPKSCLLACSPALAGACRSLACLLFPTGCLWCTLVHADIWFSCPPFFWVTASFDVQPYLICAFPALMFNLILPLGCRW